MNRAILENSFSSKTSQALVLLVMIIVVFALYSTSERKIDAKNKEKYDSWLLADEMRESSTQLTQMARLYVVTGNPLYKEHYLAVLNIRNGTQPRPERYNSTYWNLYLEKGKPPRPDSHLKIPLLTLMLQAGLTEAEFKKLNLALANSEKLVDIELESFRLMDVTGKGAEASRKRAQTILFDQNYQNQKRDITKAIDEFLQMLSTRTEREVADALSYTLFLRNIFIVLSCILLFVLYQIRRILNKTLGGNVDLIHEQIKKLGQGDFSFVPTSEKISPDSVLGWVLESQTKLQKLETKNKEAEKALHDAIREAHEALQTRDEFMSIASHEIKTPVTSLSLRLQKLKKYLGRQKEKGVMLDFEEVNTNVDICEKQCKKLTNLIEELLDLTRIRLGRLTLHMEQVDLRAPTREVINNMKSEAKGVEIHVHDSGAVIGIWDSKRIEQIVNNLISNGIKYGEGKPLEVFINEDKEKHKAQLIVKDRGPGIVPEMQTKIFERFERAVSADNISGLGLGLYIVRQIVNAHNGNIKVLSTLGEGSTFIVELPIMEPQH